MSLLELIDNTKTDKNTTHSYLDLYEKILGRKKNSAKNILEIGIWDGGSVKLWRDYFQSANVYGVDIKINPDTVNFLNLERIKTCIVKDGYDENFVKNEFKDIRFDMVLDDGPHTLDSMVKFIQLYSPLLVEDGILIIEDVQDLSWLSILSSVVPENLKKHIRTFDLRKNKNRYDDIVFVIDKSLSTV